MNPAADLAQACPYFGLSDDPATHYANPSSAHRCYATGHAIPLEAAKQSRDCLTAQHVTCPRYHRPTVSPARGVLLRAALDDRSPEPARSGALAPRSTLPSRRKRASRLAKGVLLAILVVAAGVSVLALLGSRLTGLTSVAPGGDVLGAIEQGAKPTPTLAAVATAIPSASLSAARPTTAASPVAAPTLFPTPVPSPKSEPSPQPTARPLLYTVKRGDNLIAIARFHGVTLARLLDANNIPEPNLIYVGQKIVIPRR